MNTKQKAISLLFVGLFTLNACLDEYKVPLNQKTEQLVVEAQLTDEPIIPQIKLTMTEQFGDPNSYKPVRGAYVQIIDDEGKITVFQAVGSLLGIYRASDFNFRAIAGKSYKLTIKLTNGRVYESPNEKMPQPVLITKLSANFQNNLVGGAGYRVFADLEDPKNIENYYRWTSWGVYKRKSTGIPCNFGSSICNDVCWVKAEDYSVNLFSDNGLDGNLIRKKPVFFSPFYFYGKHYVEIKQHTITRNTYQFWRRFQEQNQRSGSIFDPIPAPVLGNITNKDDPSDVALGYFEVSSVVRKRLEIPGDTLIGKVNYDRALVPTGDCSNIFPSSTLDKFPPPGW